MRCPITGTGCFGKDCAMFDEAMKGQCAITSIACSLAEISRDVEEINLRYMDITDDEI